MLYHQGIRRVVLWLKGQHRSNIMILLIITLNITKKVHVWVIAMTMNTMRSQMTNITFLIRLNTIENTKVETQERLEIIVL